VSSFNLAADPLSKPKLRGHFHQAAFFTAVGACLMLVARAVDLRSFIATSIYSLSLMGLLGVSALYHRVNWNSRQRLWMRRLDHAAIYILIAGTATPICLLSLSDHSSKVVLTVSWFAALLGTLKSVFWVKAPKFLSSILYVAAGWVAFPYLPEIQDKLGTEGTEIILVGGLVYTLGALVYAFKRPNPNPKIFGYHEIFHAMVIVAATLHFIVITRLAN
jgi:hemolysin III